MAIAHEATWDIQGGTLLRDTVEHVEKIMDLERIVLRRNIKKLETDFEEATTALNLKEEEFVVWGHRIQQIREDNEKKYRLARARFDKDKLTGRQRRGSAGVGGSASSLGFIAEVDEVSAIMERDEEDEDDIARAVSTDVTSKNTPIHLENLQPRESQPDAVPDPTIEDINALADIVAGQMTALQKQWEDLNLDLNKLECLKLDSSQATRSTPFFNDTLYSFLARGERVDRLLRDIRIETDGILLERGANQSNCGTVGFANPGEDLGSLEVPPAQGNSVNSVASQNGVHTPRSMSSRMRNILYNGDSSGGFRDFAGSSFMTQPGTNEAPRDRPRQESVRIGSRPARVVNMKPGSIRVGVDLHSMGSVARCVSTTANSQTRKAYPVQAPQEQQRSTIEARSCAPQYMLANRALWGPSHTAAARVADPLQAASSGGPPRQVALRSSSPQPVALGSLLPQPVSSITVGRRSSFNNG